MIYNRGLLIPIDILRKASGISETVITNDIKASILREVDNDYVWYHDAIRYVYDKWTKGKTEMYPPYGDESNPGVAIRVLSILDDEISPGNLTMKWKDK